MNFRFLCLIFALVGFAGLTPRVTHAADKPNVIFILADDMGYGDAGCYGQQVFKTPNIDRIAAEGVRYTQAYAGTSVCAPTRCALLTGMHMGHASIRANREIKPNGQEPMPEGTFTIAHLFKNAGYTTAAFGKWGLGGLDSPGAPDKMGFDMFYGYNCQRLAHNYFPEFLNKNREKVTLDGKTYSHDLIVKESLVWMRQHANEPFFLFLPYTLPHGNYEVPDVGPFANETWPPVLKKYASMMTRMDESIGQTLDLLKELKIDEKTLVIFASDQGADLKGALETFKSNGPFRGIKRTMYEGGLRIPFVARWPGHIKPGAVTESQIVFYDFLPTVAELIGQPLPEKVKTDGTSFIPSLLRNETQKRDFMYWELHEGAYIQAVRAGDWKGVRNGPMKALELYDLSKDQGESKNVAAENPEMVKKLEEILKREHVPNPLWSDLPVQKKPAAKQK